MCIILYCQTGVENPTKDQLKICWNNNNDGAGMAIFQPKTQDWKILKGYMSWKKFWKAFQAQNFTKDDSYVLHFRIGTSGRRDAGNTHPFIVSDNRDTCRETTVVSKYIAIHNGVVGKGEGIYSDTVCHVTDYIAPMLKYYIKDDKLSQIFYELLETATSKWFITDGKTIHMLGKWVTDKASGLTFSNDGYKYDKSYVYGNQYNQSIVEKPAGSVSDAIKKGAAAAQKRKEDKNGSLRLTPKSLATKGKKLSQKEREAFVNNFGDIDVGTRHTIAPGKLQMAFVDTEGSIIWENDSAEQMEYITCPSCSSDRSFSTSNFDVGDTVCQSCGAVFYRDSGDICSYDGDIVAESIEEGQKETSNEDK